MAGVVFQNAALAPSLSGRVLGLPCGSPTLALPSKCLARSNKSGGQAAATKVHDGAAHPPLLPQALDGRRPRMERRGCRRGSPPPPQARRERLQHFARFAAGASRLRRWRIDVEERPTIIDRNDNKRLIGRARACGMAGGCFPERGTSPQPPPNASWGFLRLAHIGAPEQTFGAVEQVRRSV
jgi:hypothetical protein